MKYLLFILLCLNSLFSYSQKKNYQFELRIRKTAAPIIVDGIMNDVGWQEAAPAGDFFMVTPMDTSKAHVNTEVKMTYDKNNLYIIAICYLPKKGPYMVESLRRDFVFGKNDNFIFFLDPYNDLTNGYTFGANAAGAQWDGTLYEGGKADLNWDNKWVSSVKNYEDKWIFEAAIPFKTIRYKKGIMQWGVNFSRLDITAAEKSSWAPVPRQFPTASLAYTGQLLWDQPLPDPGLNLSIIPYGLMGVSKDYTLDKKASFRKEVGADAKIALTSSLNLDLTVNPDYSQVEVDRQVTNLDRFELFFPERRQFFLENNDLFGNFGFTNIRPFFSRRIGLGVPISFGARLSGNIDKNWRIGAMNMQTKKVSEAGLPAQNFSVLALQRKVFARSNFRLLFINKQSLNYNYKDSTKPKYSLYNRNIGAEYNLASSNNLWTGKMMLLKSFSPGVSENSFTQASLLQYNSRKWLITWQQEYVGKAYSAEVGYVPRNNYIKLNPYIGYLFFPVKKGKLLNHGPRYNGTFYYNSSFKKTDNENLLLYIFNFRNQSIFDVWVADSYIKLLQPFDPTNSNRDTLPAGTEHRWKAFGIEFFSKPQQLLTYNVSTRFGGYYAGGNRYNVTADIGYRFQPYVGITLNMTYNNIRLPAPWNNTKFWLIGPRVDITFTNTVFLTTFVQYNNQQKNINLNTRFQWRYRPASDLFLVYTDNYYSAPLYVRNRAFVLKAVYWWNN